LGTTTTFGALAALQKLRLQVDGALSTFPKGCITTLSGKPFNFSDPCSWSFDLNDTIHALSHIYRFVGHSREPYSVLQHLLWCMKYGPTLIPSDMQCANAGRYIARRAVEFGSHDFAEAELGDVSSPLKNTVGMGYYQKLEDAVLECKLRAFNIWYDDHTDGPSPDATFEAELLHAVDRIAFLTETRDLRGGEDYEFLPRQVIQPMAPHIVRSRFVQVFGAMVEAAK